MADDASQLEAAARRITSAERVILATHENPDGDGFACMLAMRSFFERRGKEALVYMPEEVPAYLRFLPGAERAAANIPEGAYDLLLAFDYGDVERLGLGAWRRAHPNVPLLAIDHHPADRQQGDIEYIDQAAASTTVLIHRIFRVLHAEITPEIATCLLTGIVLDTGGFLHANANAEAFIIASDMMRRGAHFSEIMREIFRKKDLGALRLWGEALMRIRVDPESKMAISYITARDLQKYGAEREALADFSGILNTVEGSRLAAFLSQEPDEPEMVRASLRSEKYKDVDVSKIAAALGGGGHALAAGFKMKGSWKEVVERLISEARKNTNGAGTPLSQNASAGREE